jgi:hypothetical protein
MSQTKVKSGLLNFPDQTDFVKLPSGTTAQRPSSPEKGYSRYNTTDNKLEYWNGTIWQQLPGIVPPTIESVSYPGDDLAADPAGGQTITLTGTNFLAGATVEIEGTLAPVVTVVSKTEITFTAPAKTAGDYDILLTNGDNTTATFIDGITYNGLPSWTTPAGNLGTFPAGSTIPTITLVATEPDSGTVSYSVTTGALPSGLALSGADIDGTVPSPAGETTYNFSVTASDDENQESTERAFNIVVYLQVTNTVDEVDPFGDSSGLALYKFDGDATDESGNFDGNFINSSYSTGVFDQGGVFNGSNAYVDTPFRGLPNNSSFTYSIWANPSATQTQRVLIGRHNDATGGSAVGIDTNNTIKFHLNNYTTQRVLTSRALPNNQWSHIIGTWDGATLNVYINGEIAGTSSPSTSITYPSLNTQIGRWVGGGAQYFNGKIDQARIFNRALTPLEVESLYRERTVVCGGQADTLDILGDNSCIATYQLDGNANDLSGNYSGTPTNVSYGVGEFDLAGVFNGSSSFVNTNFTWSFNSIYSISFWAKTSTINTRQMMTAVLASNGADASGRFGFGFTSSNTFEFYIANGSSFYGNTSISSISYQNNVWHNFIVVVNGTSIKLYVDGNTTPIANLTSTVLGTASSDSLFIGRFGAYPGVYFNGSIDQVRIFNKALNSTEVTTLYNETACDALACSGTTNTLDILSDGSCIAAYPLDGSPADLSGNYNGVLVGTGSFRVGEFDLAYANNNTSAISCPPFGISGSSATFSASMWIKFDTLSFGHNFIMVTGSNTVDSTYCLGVNTSGNMLIDAYGHAYFFNNTPVVANQWYHIVGVSNASNHKLYINGSLAGEINKSLTFVSNFSAIGGRSIDNSTIYQDALRGSIDQVRIFNKALSAGEVTTLYNETACN